MSSHHARRDRPSQRRKNESKNEESEWSGWSQWEWDFDEKCFIRERWNAQGECNKQRGEKAPGTAANEPRTAADASEALRNPRLDVDYATGIDYRLEQGFNDNAPEQELIGGAASGLPHPHPPQFGQYANVSVRPGYYSAFSDPGIPTLATVATSPIPIGQGYPNSVPTTGSYDPLSMSNINNKLNYMSLSGQPGYIPTLGSEFRPGSYSSPAYSPQSQTGAAEGPKTSGENYAGADDRGYHKEQTGQDDLEEQDFSDPDEPDEPDDERDDDDRRYLQDPTTYQDVDDLLKQPTKISKDNIFTTKDPKIRKQSLYKEFQVHSSKEFKKGRIFKILWPEPLGAAGKKGTSGTEQMYIQDADFGEKVYSTIRRFVIVKRKKGHCMCVPILTYGKQGTAKNGVKPDDHAIIYTSGQPPDLLPNEPALHKNPIRVVPESRRVKLAPESRVNYSKLYTVEHNVKVCFIGKIALDSEGHFFADFNRTFDEEEP